MDERNSQPGDPREPEPSRRFVEDLAELYRPGFSVPPELDRAVLAAARRSLAVPRRPRPLIRWVAGAAAAAILVAFLGWHLLSTRVPEDLDGNGRVDILDAFLLARRIEAREALGQEWDFNDDGRVDRGDVDSIARLAVKLR